MVTNFHIAVVGESIDPQGRGSTQPEWLRVAPRPGSEFEGLPGFGGYGRALLANDLVAATPGAVLLLTNTTTVPETQITQCLRVLNRQQNPGRALSWAEEFERLCGVEAAAAGLVAIRRRDWDDLGGLSEYLPFGFIGDLERRARRFAKPLAKAVGQLGDEPSTDDDIAYGVTLLGRSGATLAGRLAARSAVGRLVRSGRVSRPSAAEAVRSAHAAARDLRHLRVAQRERNDL